jgi:Leucine-rich repeat (LRR) protein
MFSVIVDVQITKMAGLEVMVNLRELVLRSNLIERIENLSTLTQLVHLELYDNGISALEVGGNLCPYQPTPVVLLPFIGTPQSALLLPVRSWSTCRT